MLDDIKDILFSKKDICYLCRENLAKEKPFICMDCYQNLDILDGKSKVHFKFMKECYYSMSYNRFARDQLIGYKFSGKNYLYKPFGEIMLGTYRKIEIYQDIDLILFVPSHRMRQALRGYNQAELLAAYISKAIGKPLSRKNLMKIKSTKKQSSLNQLERLSNLKESFKIRDPEEIRGKKILLIDDIVTTGTTLEECSKVLLDKGAKEVLGLTLTTSQI